MNKLTSTTSYSYTSGSGTGSSVEYTSASILGEGHR